jgi:glycine cleavage system regulatory protein
MDQHFVMTIIGSDRPGLVERVAETVAKHGGNWLESRMCRLGGEFAGLLRISAPKETMAELEAELRKLETNGLTLTIRRDQPVQGTEQAEGERRFTLLEIIGHDRPGIVREISKALAEHEVNVEELQTACESAPMSGEMLFKATARLRVPANADVSALRQRLEQIAVDLVIDISLSEHSRL